MLRRILPPLVIGVIALAAFQYRIRHEMADFAVYRQASVRLLNAEPLYRETDGHYQFKYLPAFAMIAVPVAILDEEMAKAVWFAASIGALVILIRWSVRFLPERRRGLPLLVGLTFLFMAKFYAHELVLGQANVFFAVLVVLAIGAIQMEVPAVAGILLAAAVCIKPYALLFAPWLLVTGQRRAVMAFAATCAVALAAPITIYGFQGNIALLGDWWHTVNSTVAPNLLVADNVSFAAMWAKWIGPGLPARLAAGVTSAAALGLVIDAWSRRKDVNEPDYLEAAALLLLVPLLSPQGWDYVLLLGTPAVALLLDRIPEMARGWRVATWVSLAVMGLTSFDMLGRAAYGRFMALSVVSVCAVVLLAALTQLRRQKLA